MMSLVIFISLIIASDIKLVFNSSTITMMHGPINIRFKKRKFNVEVTCVRLSVRPSLRLSVRPSLRLYVCLSVCDLTATSQQLNSDLPSNSHSQPYRPTISSASPQHFNKHSMHIVVGFLLQFYKQVTKACRRLSLTFITTVRIGAY